MEALIRILTRRPAALIASITAGFMLTLSGCGCGNSTDPGPVAGPGPDPTPVPVAEVSLTGAVDSHTGTVTVPYTLGASLTNNAGTQSVFVNPITTIVQEVMQASGATDPAAAIDQVRHELGMTISPLDNFIERRATDSDAARAGTIAQIVTALKQQVDPTRRCSHPNGWYSNRRCNSRAMGRYRWHHKHNGAVYYSGRSIDGYVGYSQRLNGTAVNSLLSLFGVSLPAQTLTAP